jgi:ATP-binding cassette, subfamily B, multidrug efflux pump
MESVNRLTRFLKPYWRWMVLAPLLMTLEVAMDLLQPKLIERIVDVGIANLDLSVVLGAGALMIGLALIGLVGGGVNGIFAVKASQGFAADLREALFRKVQSLSFANLDKLGTGQLVTNLTNDVTQVQMALYMMMRILIRAPLLLVGSLVMVTLTTPQLLWLPLALLGVVLIGVLLIIRRAYPLFRVVQETLDALNAVMQENLAGVRVVKAFVRADHEKARFHTANEDLMEKTIRVVRVVAVTMPFAMLAMNLGLVGVIWFGGLQVTAGGMTTGEIISFTNYLQRTLISLMMVSMIVLQVSRAEASARRIGEVLETEPAVQNRPDAIREHHFQGRVAFDQVCFGYESHCGDPVLNQVDFVAEPGQTVALLGSTGAGKSSLVHLIPRFYDVTGGRVTIDGVDVRDLDKAELRRNIGIALQETVLFSGTIRDNIRYGRPDASDEEVVAAAKAAQAHDFILSFPDGYDTELGQRGVNLSGGQKQRIAIARALLLQPAVLILDDSTSSVDVETEVEIQAALEELMRDRTSFVIAQRISTVLTADKILVLDDGQIAAEGTHEELLAASPIYREIYDSQLGDGNSRGHGNGNGSENKNGVTHG